MKCNGIHTTTTTITQIESDNEYIVTWIYSSFRLNLTALFWQLSLQFPCWLRDIISGWRWWAERSRQRGQDWLTGLECNESYVVWGELRSRYLRISSVSVSPRHIVMTTERITHKYSDTSLPLLHTAWDGLVLSPALYFVVLFCFQNVKDLGSFPHLDLHPLPPLFYFD